LTDQEQGHGMFALKQVIVMVARRLGLGIIMSKRGFQQKRDARMHALGDILSLSSFLALG